MLVSQHDCDKTPTFNRLISLLRLLTEYVVRKERKSLTFLADLSYEGSPPASSLSDYLALSTQLLCSAKRGLGVFFFFHCTGVI